MANMSDYLEGKILNHLFRGTSYSAPSSVYIALCTDTLDDTDDGASIAEPTGTGYARQAVASNATNWSAPNADGTIKNSEEIKWDSVQWSATIKAVAICDALTNGNVLFWGTLTAQKVVTVDDSISFGPNTLSIQIDN
jgi:hypothetical protein